MSDRTGETGGERFALSLPPEASLIDMARLFAASIARHYGCEEELVEDVKIAISEACTNSIKAHRDASIDEPIQVVGRLSDDELWFEVIDVGPGFDYMGSRGSAEMNTPPGGLYEGSLGLTLIQALFPSSKVERNSGPGTTVRFAVPLYAGAIMNFGDESPL